MKINQDDSNYWSEKLLKPENKDRNFSEFWEENSSNIILNGNITSVRLTIYTRNADLTCEQAAHKLIRMDPD